MGCELNPQIPYTEFSVIIKKQKEVSWSHSAQVSLWADYISLSSMSVCVCVCVCYVEYSLDIVPWHLNFIGSFCLPSPMQSYLFAFIPQRVLKDHCWCISSLAHITLFPITQASDILSGSVPGCLWTSPALVWPTHLDVTISNTEIFLLVSVILPLDTSSSVWSLYFQIIVCHVYWYDILYAHKW